MTNGPRRSVTEDCPPPARPPRDHISSMAYPFHGQQPPRDGTEGFGLDRAAKEAPSLGKLSEGLQASQGDLQGLPTGSPPLDCSVSVDPSTVCGGGGGARLSAGQWFAREERKAIDAYVQDRELEVVVILEGTDTSTGSTVQVTCVFQFLSACLQVSRLHTRHLIDLSRCLPSGSKRRRN